MNTEPFATLQGWEPTGDFLMLTPILLPEVSPGGIVLPSNAYRKTNRGIVRKVGPTANSVFLGQECFFPANVDYTIEIDETTHEQVYLVRQADVIMFRVPVEPSPVS